MLCDTNIISELSRMRPDVGVLAWAEQVHDIYLSVVTLEEIHFGLAWKNNTRIRQWFELFLQQQCEILLISPAIACQAGELRGHIGFNLGNRQCAAFIDVTAKVYTQDLFNGMNCAVYRRKKPLKSPVSAVRTSSP